jgi:hypothetical protein
MRIKFAWLILLIYVLLVGRALMHGQTISNYATGITNVANLTTAATVKNGNASLLGFIVTNGAASTCYLEFIAVGSSGSTPALGTNVAFSVPVAATTAVYATPTGAVWGNFPGGLAVGLATAAGGSSACGTAGTAVVFWQ